MAHSHSMYGEVYRMLQDGSEREAMQILRQIRSGHTPEAIIRLMEMNNAAFTNQIPSRCALQSFLISLAHSTGSLQGIIRLATSTLSQSSNVHLPQPSDYLDFGNSIVHLSHIENLLRRWKPVDNRLLISLPSDATHSSDRNAHRSLSAQSSGFSDGDYVVREVELAPRVPAATWTSVTSSDEAVSHLVSLFFAWINPTWLFVEKELFLKSKCNIYEISLRAALDYAKDVDQFRSNAGMRSKRLDSPFCSPLLVNSICAIACVSRTSFWFYGDVLNHPLDAI